MATNQFSYSFPTKNLFSQKAISGIDIVGSMSFNSKCLMEYGSIMGIPGIFSVSNSIQCMCLMDYNISQNEKPKEKKQVERNI